MKQQLTRLAMGLLLVASVMTSLGLLTACGDDEPFVPELTFTQGGEDQTVDADAHELVCTLIGNIPISQLSATSSEAWCSVTLEYAYSTTQSSNYNYRLTLNVSENTSLDSRTATIKISSPESNIEKSFTLTQQGAGPFLIPTEGGKDQTVNADARTITATYSTNLSIDASSDVDWCSATLERTSAIGERPATYLLSCNLAENISDHDRTAVITVRSTDGQFSSSFSIKQEATTLTLETNAVGFDKYSSTRTIRITSNNNWYAYSSATEWCTVERNGEYLSIRVTKTNVDRDAVITFSDRADRITVSQTKYTIGETYNENGVIGTVGYIGDTKRFIYKKLDGYYRYISVSTPHELYIEHYYALSADDGDVNVADLASKTTAWRMVFPAAGAADKLNTNGITGWYLPAINELNELSLVIDYNTWSSTLKADGKSWATLYDQGYLMNYGSSTTKATKDLLTECAVIAIHKF